MLWCVVFEVNVIISSAVNSMALYLEKVFTFSFIFSSPHDCKLRRDTSTCKYVWWA
jgi:hypothetical protein